MLRICYYAVIINPQFISHLYEKSSQNQCTHVHKSINSINHCIVFTTLQNQQLLSPDLHREKILNEKENN